MHQAPVPASLQVFQVVNEALHQSPEFSLHAVAMVETHLSLHLVAVLENIYRPGMIRIACAGLC